MKSWARPDLRPAGPRSITRTAGVEPAHLPEGSALSTKLRPFSANDPSRLQSGSGLHRPGPAEDAEALAPGLSAGRLYWCPPPDSNRNASRRHPLKMVRLPFRQVGNSWNRSELREALDDRR